MFAARQRPLLVLEDRLLALRLSLNTPVLATAELPSGPARAAIFAYAEGNARRFAVAIRAIRGESPVIYELTLEVPSDADGWSVALDASLSFGESMGFVFDDEMVTDRRAETLRRAVGRLRELITPGELEIVEATPPATGARSGTGEELSEILLEDELDSLAPDEDTEGPDATGPIAMEEPVAPPLAAPLAAAPQGVALSKFRSSPPNGNRPVAPKMALPPRAAAPQPAPRVASSPAPESSSVPAREARGGATLGRVRPVRVRVDAESGQQADPLLRLLADF